MDKVLLIDGHSVLNRAFYGVPLLTNYEGIHTNAVYGFINIMLKALEDEKAGYIAVAFDLKAPTFRHKMFAEYKGTRKPMPDELREQVPIIKDVLASMGIPVITKEGYEADDILGTLAKRSQKNGFEVSILSGDRDLLQLADEHIKIRLPKTIKGKTEIENYFPKDVVDKYQVTPLEFIDLKALMGDSSDNIPGVPGIGEKTATAIITRFHSIEEAYAHVDEVTPTKAKNNLSQYYDMAVMSKKLATIDIDAPIDFKIEDASIGELFTSQAYEIFKRLELKSLLKKFDESSILENNVFSPELIMVEDISDLEKLSQNIKNEGFCGVSLETKEKELVSVVFCVSQKIYRVPCEGFITEDYLCATLKELGQVAELNFLDLKGKLDFIKVDINDKFQDVALMAYLVNPLLSEYSYENLGREYLDLEFKSGASSEEKQAYEAYVACYAYDKLYDKLSEYGMLNIYKEIELPLVYVLKSMEDEGIRVNKDALKEYGNNLGTKITELEKFIYEQAEIEFNINSPKQLGEILFEKMGLPAGKKTKTGYSTSAEVLEKLSNDYPIVKNILEYRTLAKLKSTYADGLYEYIDADDRIRSTFNQTITATGRISSTEPNLQNIPIRMELGRQIRKVFIPKDGCVFVDADYSQIELRLLAHMSGDDNLISAYNEDSDIHRITASKVFNVPLNEVTSTQRSNAKAVNFGIVYGISSYGLSQDLSITKAKAKEYIEGYFETYPVVKKYLDDIVSFAKENGYVTTIYNRRRPIPEITSSNFMQRQFGERIAMNSPLQGTAADIIKIAMINVYKRLAAENLQSKLILQIHDELLIEAANGEEMIVKQILEEEMCKAADLKVKLEVDIHSGQNWFEAK